MGAQTKIFIPLITVFLTAQNAFSQETWNLKRLYESSLKVNETVGISAAQIRQAEALYREALGSTLPEFFFRYQSLRQDSRNLSASTENPQNEAMFRGRKILLSGYREIAAIRGGKSLVNQAKFLEISARQTLLADNAGAFYGTLRSQADWAATTEILKLARKRLTEIQKRVKVGRSRQADLASAEYQATTLETRELEAERQTAELRDLLSFLAGQRVEGTLEAAADDSAEPAALEEYLNKTSQRPDVRALEAAVRVSKANLHAARAGHLPSVDITGNYYTQRPRARRNVDWDVTLGVEVPIFAWGATQAAVSGARAEMDESKLNLSFAQRQADLEIRAAHRDLLFARRQFELQQKALGAARRDYELQERDYGLGLVTNLEVLESLNRLYEAETASNQARLSLTLARLELDIASGLTPEEILK